MSEPTHHHPSPDQLAAFRQGKLSPADWATIERHLIECGACEQKLKALPGDVPSETVLNAPGSAPIAPTITGPGTTPPAGTVPPELVGHPRYRVLGLLGSGGMGAVFKAEHQLMERTVALKVINRSMTQGADAIDRFRREVKAAARLSHPNIVAAYDADQAGSTHFLVMEFVQGTSLDRVLAERGLLPIGLACNYVRQAAEGLQHAHECGMVHRDIKPQNLMLTPKGQVKILDFGLARFARGDGASVTLTQTGMTMGTPDYIAPEQAMNARQADIRADIYSLGCTLYHLLSGQVPFPVGVAFDKLLAHLESPPTPLVSLRPDVPADLVQVVERMMAKDPAQRYQTPAEVVQALTPFADPSPTPSAASAATATQSTLPATAVHGGPASSDSSPPQRRRLVVVIASLIVAGLAGVAAAGYYLYRQRQQPVAPNAPPPRTAEEFRRLQGHDGPVHCVVFLPGGHQALSAGQDRTLRLWDIESGQEVAQLKGPRLPTVCLAVSPDGSRALLGTAGMALREDRRVPTGGAHLFDLAKRQQIRFFPGQREPVSCVAFSPDGRRGLVAGIDPEVRQYTLETGQPLPSLTGHSGRVWSVLYLPGGRKAATAGADKTIRVWNAETGGELNRFEGHTEAVRCLALAPDGRRLLSGGADGTVRLWELDKPKPVATLSGHSRVVTTVAFLPDGRHAVSGSFDQTVRVWDLDSGRTVYEIAGLGYAIESIAVAPDGRYILIAGHNSFVRLWRLPPLTP